MLEVLSLIIAVAGGTAVLVGSFFSVRKFYRWLRPVRIVPSVHLVFDGSSPDEITAKVTNRGSEPLYIERAAARSTYPLSTIFVRHLRHPLVPRRLYGAVRYGATTFDMLASSPQKVDPLEQVQLRHRLSQRNPLSVFLTTRFLVELRASTGRTFRSSRMEVPERWMFVPRAPPASRTGAPPSG